MLYAACSAVTPDDELVCSKHVVDSINETNEINKVCILLVFLTYTAGDICYVCSCQFGVITGNVILMYVSTTTLLLKVP